MKETYSKPISDVEEFKAENILTNASHVDQGEVED